MSRVERTLSLPRSIPPLTPSTPSSPLACRTTSLHAGKGFIEIYSCLRLHVHTYTHARARTHAHIPGLRECMYERARVHAYVRMQLCTVRSGVASRALTRSQPSQVHARVESYYQSTRRAYNLIRAVGRRRRESSRKFCAALRRAVSTERSEIKQTPG